MAISRNSIGTGNNSGAVTNPSNTFNNVSGNLLAVGFAYDKNGSVTAATYGGVAMTSAGTVTMTGWVYKVALYYLINPPTGSNTVNFTLSASAQATLIYPMSYNCTSANIDSTNSGYITTSGAQNQNISLSPTTANNWFVGFYNGADVGTTAAGTNATLVTGLSGNQTGMIDTNGVKGPGATNFGISWGNLTAGGEGAVIVGMSFKETTGVIRSNLLTMGIS